MDNLATKAPSGQGVLQPGRNCWRIEPAERVAFLVDGEAYFTAFREAAARAQRSLLILGWDIDSQTRLVCDDREDGLPRKLGDFLNAVVAARRRLHVHILIWDFAMIYAFEREWFPVYKLDWKTHRRLHCRLDDRHPAGASHHQKVVVVDDRVAFVGGMDVTRARWDTPGHEAGNPLRCNPDGRLYAPFHDVQMMIDGAAAAALGDLARDRWKRATGRKLSAPRGTADPWPPAVAADIVDARVAIARTEPAYEGRPEVEEIKQLFVDGIAAARHTIYMENQYFTANAIGDALARRLEEPDGPEIVLVSRIQESGWLEESTMGVLRARLQRRLCDLDRHGRFRAYYPVVPDLGSDFVNIHSKVLIVDDTLLCVGSANLNNRSMGLDTECNLAVEAAGDDPQTSGIAAFRNKLLAEHLGTEAAAVRDHMSRSRSLIATIEALSGGERTLKVLEPRVSAEVDAWVPGSAIVDPERPVDPEKLLAELLPRAQAKPSMAVNIVAVAVLVLAAMAVAGRGVPIAERLDLSELIAFAAVLRDSWAAPIAVLVGYVVGSLLAIPATVLIAVTILVFDPYRGAFYALAGSVVSAALVYGIGGWIGRNTVRRIAGRWANDLSRKLSRRGLGAVLAVRVLPVAPFAMVSLVAGASRVGLRDFILGTALGMIPGTIAIAVFVSVVGAAAGDPALSPVAAIAGVLAAGLAGAALIRRWLRRVADASGSLHPRTNRPS